MFAPDSSTLFSRILQLIEDECTFAVATVLRAEGSSPAKAGAKAIIELDGAIYGTIGGGAVEAKALRLARPAMQSHTAVVFDSVLRGTGVGKSQPICGGAMRVLVDPGAAQFAPAYRQALETLKARERGIWFTTIYARPNLSVGCRFLPERELTTSTDQGLMESLQKGRGHGLRTVVHGANRRDEVFAELLLPKPRLLIVGGGHVGQAVARLGAQVGFDIVVVEDRPEFADGRLFPPGAEIRCGKVDSIMNGLPIEADTYIVIATRNHQQDSLALRSCIKRPSGYIGMIGSRRKVPLVRQHFVRAGWVTAKQFAVVHAPIGLDIGALTVPEIAVSIVAEIIAVRRKRPASAQATKS